MLFADKQALETDLKVSLLAIRERELELYADNCRHIGAQAALLAGFAYSALTFEVAEVDSVCTIALAMKRSCSVMEMATFFGGVYQLVAYSSMALNTLAIFRSLLSSMLGPGLALRGQDGAMDQAVEGLALEYRTTYTLFITAVVLYFLFISMWIAMDYDPEYGWKDATVHVLLGFTFLHFIWSTLSSVKRIWKKFRLPPECSVAGNFDPDGTAGTSIRQRSKEAIELDRLSVNKRWRDWPRRQYLYLTIATDEILGISSSTFEERYKKSAKEKVGKQGRAKNNSLYAIIQYLEAGPHQPAAGGRRPEEKSRLAAYDSAAADHLHAGGTISPADSEASLS